MSKGFLVLPIIGIIIIIYVVGVNFQDFSLESLEPMVYEINTLAELCEKKSDVFGGYTYKVYQDKLRSMTASGGSLDVMNPNGYANKLKEQLVKDTMWNYKINPELGYLVNDHIQSTKYLECEN